MRACPEVGDAHFVVEKATHAGKTTSFVRRVVDDDRRLPGRAGELLLPQDLAGLHVRTEHPAVVGAGVDQEDPAIDVLLHRGVGAVGETAPVADLRRCRARFMR